MKGATVLHIRNAMNDGGVEKGLLNWFSNLDRTNFPTLLACFENPGNPENCLLNPVRRLGIPTFLLPWGVRKRLFAAVGAVVQLIRTHHVDILHSHDAKADLVAYIASRRTGIPIIGTAYAWFGKSSYLRVRVYEWLDAHVMRRFAAVIAVSESLRRETIGFGVDQAKIVTIYPGVDFAALQRETNHEEVRRFFKLSEKDIVIVNLARLDPEKGQSYLLAAFPAVLAEFPNAKLVIVGKGPLEDKLKTQCRELGIEGNVIFAGFPDNLPALLQVVHLQAHSSLYEGLPMAVLLGMAAGIPVVATDVGGVSEVLVPDETGSLIPPADSECLSAAILSMLRDPERARRLARAGKELVSKRYSVESGARDLQQLYSDVLSRSRARLCRPQAKTASERGQAQI
jgi:glycosyltransferase involved in cell wall biosynthesis